MGQGVIIRCIYLPVPGVMKIGLANFACLIACYCVVCLCRIFFSLVLWLAISLEVDVDRITILPLSPPSLFFFSFSCLPTILSLK